MDNNDGEEICQSYDDQYEEGNDSYSLESHGEDQEQTTPVIAPPRKIFHKTETQRPTFDNNSSFSEYLDIPEDGILLRTLFVGLRNANDSSKQKFLIGDEIVGCILSVGVKVPKSPGFKEGDEVLVVPKQGCKQCEICSSANNWHFCNKPEPSFSSVVDLLSDNVDTDILSSVYAIHDWRSIVKLPKEIPGYVGCMLSGNSLRMYSAILEAKPYFEKSTRLRGFSNLLLICGGDRTGCSELHHLWCLYLLRNIFCDANIKVILASYFKSIVKVAPTIESDDAVLLVDGQNMADAVTMQGCNKMDVVIDAVGSQETFELACSSLTNGGLATVIGTSTTSQTVSIQVQRLLNHSLTIKAVGSCSKELLKEFLDVLSVQGVWYNFTPHLQIANNKEFKELNCSEDSSQNMSNLRKFIIKFEP